MGFNKKVPNSEVDLGLLQHQRQIALQYLLYHKALHLGCSSSPRSASGIDVLWSKTIENATLKRVSKFWTTFFYIMILHVHQN